MKKEKLSIALLCDLRPGVAGTILDHIRAFERYSRHSVVPVHTPGDTLARTALENFDGIMVHYSLVACLDWYIAPSVRQRIRRFQGFKAAFVQDDYRFINRTVEALAYMRIHALFALPGPEIMDVIYPDEKLPGVKKVTVLTGYVPEDLVGTKTPLYESRTVDVAYRARKLVAWIGEHTLQKWQIAERFGADAAAYGLKVDLSCREEDRIYGDAWIRFVANAKAVLGTESGASVFDFTGRIQKRVERHLAGKPDTPFEVLRDLYFREEDGRHLFAVISPRCFEAAALRTLMVQYEGDYSGILQPWKHYVPLRKDHANMAEVVDVIRTPARAGKIIQTAYDDLVASGRYSFRAMIALVDATIDEIMARPDAPCVRARIVKAGDELVRLDQADARVALEQAEASLARAVRQLRDLRLPAAGADEPECASPAGGSEIAGDPAGSSLPWRAMRRAWREHPLALKYRIRGLLKAFVAIHGWNLPGRNGLVRGVASGIASFVKSILLRVDVWAVVAFEVRVIRELQGRLGRDPAAEAWLVLDRGASAVALVAVWPDRALRGEMREISMEEFATSLSDGLRIIEWINGDLLGLGTRASFYRRFRFRALARLCRADWPLVVTILLGQRGPRPWFTRMVAASIADLTPERQDPADDSIAPGAEEGVPVPVEPDMIRSDLRFYPGHDPSVAFDGTNETYAAAIEGQPVPQRFSVSLMIPYTVSRIVLGWESDDNLARDFVVTLSRIGAVCWSRRVSSNARSICEFEVAEVVADSLELSVEAFLGQQRLLLRRLDITASTVWLD